MYVSMYWSTQQPFCHKPHSCCHTVNYVKENFIVNFIIFIFKQSVLWYFSFKLSFISLIKIRERNQKYVDFILCEQCHLVC